MHLLQDRLPFRWDRNAASLEPLAARLSVALAALGCLWLVVRLVWLLLEPIPEQTRAKLEPVVAPSPPPLSIAKWHLFGNPQMVRLAELAQPAPATTLKLVLRGTLALPDPRQGIAVIADEHGVEHAYKVGDEVASRARLEEVYPDHVVLQHEGAAETLTLPRAEERAPERPVAEPRMVDGGAPTPNGGVPLTYVPPRLDHAALDWSRVQKQLQLDPTALARQLHIEPVFIDGKLTGARLSGGGEVANLMQKAGIRPTDLITAVNGTKLASLSDPQRFMDNLKNATSLQLTVERDGKPATLTLDLR
jgi:general secretion pathway protein C